jgi:hypothetical protein
MAAAQVRAPYHTRLDGGSLSSSCGWIDFSVIHSTSKPDSYTTASALVAVAAAEGAGQLGAQEKSSLSRLAFVLFKVLLTRCLHAL